MNDKQQCFEHLVAGFSGDIYRIAYWLCREHEMAEDLVQETFLRAWRALDTLQDDSSARAWLITILRRENARRFSRKQLELVNIEDHEPAIYEDKWPEAAVERDELHEAIGLLPIAYREPLILQQLGGFSCEEIAETLNLSKSAVMTRLFRAKQKLSALLSAPPDVARKHKKT